MSRKLLIVLVVLLVLASAGAFVYYRWSEARKKVDLWTLVPSDAVLVWESNNNEAFYDHLRTTSVWETLAQSRYIQQLQENMALIDSAAGKKHTLGTFLKNKSVLASLHVVNNTDADLVFYVPVTSVNEHRFVRNVVESLERSDRFSFEVREYQGHQLTDVRNNATGKEITYFSYRNNLIVSNTSFLIEEIVRNIERGQLVSPAKEFAGTSYLNLPEVWASVWVNYRQLPVFLSLFFADKLHNDLSFLFSLCRSGMLELKLSDDRIFLNGFSEPDTSARALGAQMTKLSPQPLSLSAVVPSRAAVVVFFGGEQLRLHMTGQKENLPQEPVAQAAADSLRRHIGSEIAFGLVDTYNATGAPDKLLFARTPRPEVLRRQLLEAQQALSPGMSTEYITGKPVYVLNSPQLPQRIFGSFFKGFEQLYVSLNGEHVLMAEDLNAMRSLLLDIANESVWGKSVEQKAFLEEAQQDANLGVFVNTNNSWNLLMRYLDPAHRQDVIKNASLIRRFGHMSLQFSRQENQFYTSFLMRHTSRPGLGGQRTGFEEEASATFARRLISQPYPLANPANKSPEVMVLDSALHLHLVSADGKKIWSDSIGAALVTPVMQIDGGAGKDAQYVFATANRIYSFGRNGKMGSNYPFNLADSVQLKHLTIADEGDAGKQSFIAADFMGNLYWFDQQGNLLEGWQPKALGQPLAMKPLYLRVGGQPVVLVLTDNGTVYAFNRYGETYPGFPFSLKAGTRGGIHVRQGATFSRTHFTVATVSGEVVTFNLLGDVVRRNQLMKASRNSRFELVPDQAGNSYLLARQELGKLSLYDPDLKLVMEQSYVTSAPKEIQYFHFGADRRLYVVIEKGPQKTYLYNSSGQLLGKRPIPNVFPLDVRAIDASRSYQFFLVSGNKLQRISVSASE